MPAGPPVKRSGIAGADDFPSFPAHMLAIDRAAASPEIHQVSLTMKAASGEEISSRRRA